MAEDHSMINTDFSQFTTVEALMHQCDVIAGETDSLLLGLFDVESLKFACSELYHLGPHDFMDQAEVEVRNILFRVMLGLRHGKLNDFFHLLPQTGEDVPPGKIGINTFGILGQHLQFCNRMDIMTQAMGSVQFFEATGDIHLMIQKWTMNFLGEITDIFINLLEEGLSEQELSDEEEEADIDISRIYVPDNPSNWVFVNGLEEVEIATLAADELRCPFCWNDFGVVDVEAIDAETSTSDYQEFLDSIPRERLNDPIQTPCGHLFGRGCLFLSMTTSPLCPICREHLHHS